MSKWIIEQNLMWGAKLTLKWIYGIEARNPETQGVLDIDMW